MVTPEFMRTMARYNRWQNGSIYAACEGLSDADRKAQRGAFFGSIHGTLSHLLWGDMLWLNRFAGAEKPNVDSIAGSPDMEPDWEKLKSRRGETDDLITDWVEGLQPSDLLGDLKWFSGAVNREVSKPRALLFVHFFNHQAHHRGQVHAMVTAAGGKPSDTDLPFME